MVDLLALRNAVKARLDAVPNLDVHTGEVVTVRLDPDGKAHIYAALWAGPGRNDNREETLRGDAGQRIWSFQVTAAGGDDTRALFAAGEVLRALLGVRLSPAYGLLRLAADPGNVRLDTDVTPHRSYLPLLFTADITD